LKGNTTERESFITYFCAIQYLEEFFLSFLREIFENICHHTYAHSRSRQKQKEKETDPSKTTTIQTTTEKNAFRSSPFAM
tara:strand:- start:298 stop:537 length:240 start_codon:yes stop_codon:yes gene_type:complete